MLAIFWLWLLLQMLCFIVLEARTGSTPGKRLVGIRVVRAGDLPGNATGIGVRASVIRNVLILVDGLFLGLVGVIAAARSPQTQRLGDKAAGTFVVRRDSVV